MKAKDMSKEGAKITAIISEVISTGKWIGERPITIQATFLYYMELHRQPFCFMSITRHLRWDGKQYRGLTPIAIPDKLFRVQESPAIRTHWTGTQTVYERNTK